MRPQRLTHASHLLPEGESSEIGRAQERSVSWSFEVGVREKLGKCFLAT